jgi:hypothetical protein
MLNSEGHRRLIGNDLAIIFFLEEGGEFDPTNILALGQVPVVFIVVTPYQGSYRQAFGYWRFNCFRVAFLSANSLKSTVPLAPVNILDGPTMKDLVLTKSKLDLAFFFEYFLTVPRVLTVVSI